MIDVQVGQVWEHRDYFTFLEITEIIPDVLVVGILKSLDSSDVVGFKYPLPRFLSMWTLRAESVSAMKEDLLPVEIVRNDQTTLDRDSYTRILIGSLEPTGRKVGWDD